MGESRIGGEACMGTGCAMRSPCMAAWDHAWLLPNLQLTPIPGIPLHPPFKVPPPHLVATAMGAWGAQAAAMAAPEMAARAGAGAATGVGARAVGRHPCWCKRRPSVGGAQSHLEALMGGCPTVRYMQTAPRTATRKMNKPTKTSPNVMFVHRALRASAALHNRATSAITGRCN